MIEVTATTDVDAPPERVWDVLTDFGAFHAWNPFIREAHGSTELGGSVHVRVKPSLPVPLAFRATIIECEEGHRLRWRGHVVAPWVAAGDHTFEIEPLPDGRSRIIQRETFTGFLPKLAGRLLRDETRRGFEAMNHALAERAAREPA